MFKWLVMAKLRSGKMLYNYLNGIDMPFSCQPGFVNMNIHECMCWLILLEKVASMTTALLK